MKHSLKASPLTESGGERRVTAEAIHPIESNTGALLVWEDGWMEGKMARWEEGEERVRAGERL